MANQGQYGQYTSYENEPWNGVYNGGMYGGGDSSWLDSYNNSGWGGTINGLIGFGGGLYGDWRKQKDYENYKKDWEKYNTYQPQEVKQMSDTLQQRLNQAKTTAMSNLKDNMAARGYGAGSGVIGANYQALDRAYMQALAQGFSQLPVAGTAKNGASVPRRPQNTEDAWLEGLGHMAYHSPQLIQWYMNWQNEKAKTDSKSKKEEKK